MSPQTIDNSEKVKTASRKKMVADYKRVVIELSSQVAEWIEVIPDWTTSQEQILERPPQAGGGFHVPKTLIHTPEGRLILEPLGLSINNNAIVDFSAWPSSYHVRLLHDLSEQGTWRIRTESGIFLRDVWSRESFLQLAHDLLAADWE